MSAHSASQRRGWLSALAAQVSEFVFETVDEPVEQGPATLEPQPVIAVVSAARRSGATTVARMLGAELAGRAGGAAIVTSSAPIRRSAPPVRQAVRLATAMAGLGRANPVGRLCLVQAVPGVPDAPQGDRPRGDALDRARWDAPDRAREDVPDRAREEAPDLAAIVAAARYLAPVVLDLPADGSAAGVASVADRIAVVASATDEPALLDAVAHVIGGHPVKVVNRVAEAGVWEARADILLSDSRIAARAATLGTRPLGSLGAGITALAEALGR